jgi:hypothetical protein
MVQHTPDDAVAFIEAMRLTLEGKVGFRWMADKLADLAQYVDSMQAENGQLKAYLAETGMIGDYEAYAARRRPGSGADGEGAPDATRGA